MKTKRLIQLMSFMMFIVASVCVSSCKSDPEETTPPKQEETVSIVGTWVKFYEKETKWTLTNSEWVKTKEAEAEEKGESAVYFGADGKYYKMYLGSDGNWEKGTVYSYDIQGNILIISGSSSKTRTFSINGTVLEIIETELSGNQKEVEIKRYRKV